MQPDKMRMGPASAAGGRLPIGPGLSIRSRPRPSAGIKTRLEALAKRIGDRFAGDLREIGRCVCSEFPLDRGHRYVAEAAGHDGLKAGELLNIEMPIPPTEGLLEYGGRFSSYGRVLRVHDPKSGTTADSAAVVHTIAMEFCESPKLQV